MLSSGQGTFSLSWHHKSWGISSYNQGKSRASRKQSMQVCIPDVQSLKDRESSLRTMTDSIEKIKQQLKYVHMTASPYDTAWIAMVPHPSSHQDPCFDHCLDWILQNQHENGSWGNFNLGPSLLKDKLSSTLACVLALKKWSCGEEHIKKGVRFLVSNIGSIFDEQLTTPIGFNIIFPGMIKLATEVGLKLPLGDTVVGEIFSLQKLELQRNSINSARGRKEYMAYIAEGLGSSQDLSKIMKFQRANGSILNSPSTTAYLLTRCYDNNAFNYLSSLLQQVGSTVPATYPMEMHCHLCTVDTLQNLGIDQFFSDEIKIILDRAYSCWLERDEQIISDMATCAMAFRLLRMNGYDISSDLLMKFEEARSFHDSMQGYLRDMRPVIEIHKASQTKLFPNEDVLNKINLWSSILLKEEISTKPISHDRTISQEVKFALEFPFYANLDRLEHKRSIEQFNFGKIQMLKTSHIPCIANEDVLKLAVGDFNNCQSIYKEELQDLNSWVKQCKLDQLQFARQKLTYCYLSGAATLFSPELLEARISWSKCGILTTVVDDFFDVGGSIEELESLVALFDKWDGKCRKEFYSEQVQIIYMAIHGHINEVTNKAFPLQNRDITDHLVKIWLSLLRSMMTESRWQRNKSIPTLEEYMANGAVSFALGPIILPALYLVGPKITEEIIKHDEYDHLFRLVSTCGRLLNDVRGFAREGKEGKLNSVSLRILNSGTLSIEEAEKDVKKLIEDIRTELLQLVLKEGTTVPKPCKELFWKMYKILHLFYMNTDGFSSPKEMVSAVNAVIHDSLNV